MKKKNESWYPGPRYLFRKNMILHYIKNENLMGKTILEIGYGSGDMLCEYAKRGAKVWGYDFSDLAYESAKSRIEERHMSNIYISKDKQMLWSKEYDYVVACEVLEHIEFDAKELQEWCSLLKPTGKLILSVPARMKKFSYNDRWAGHYRRYEKRQLIHMCQNIGYEVECCYSYPFPVNIFLDYLLNRACKKRLKERGGGMG